eukprot:2457744-Rhodomonas_salina.4
MPITDNDDIDKDDDAMMVMSDAPCPSPSRMTLMTTMMGRADGPYSYAASVQRPLFGSRHNDVTNFGLAPLNSLTGWNKC